MLIVRFAKVERELVVYGELVYDEKFTKNKVKQEKKGIL